MGRFTQRSPAQLTATKTWRTCYPDHLSRFSPCCPERHFSLTWLTSACRLFKEICNLYSVMYIKVVVKVGFFVVNVGCGWPRRERETLLCAMYVIHLLSVLQGNRLVFLSVKHTSPHFCLYLLHGLVHNCTNQIVFLLKNIEHYIKQEDTLNLRDLSYFSTLKSGQEKFSSLRQGEPQKLQHQAFVFILLSTVWSCRNKMENLSFGFSKLWKQNYNDWVICHKFDLFLNRSLTIQHTLWCAMCTTLTFLPCTPYLYS